MTTKKKVEKKPTKRELTAEALVASKTEMVEKKPQPKLLNLVSVLYGEALAKEQERDRHAQTSHYPSGLCAVLEDGRHYGRCRRQLYYSFVEEVKTNPIDSPSLLKMSMGDGIHELYSDLVASALAKIGATDISREVEVRWNDENLGFGLSGRLDTVFTLEGCTYGIDWKSKFGYGMDAIKKGDVGHDAIFQMMAYLKQKVIPLTGIYLLYIDRGSAYLYGFYFSFKRGELVVWIINNDSFGHVEFTWDDVVRGQISVEQSVSEKKVPDRDFDVTKDWQCRYCSYANLCWGREITKKK